MYNMNKKALAVQKTITDINAILKENPLEQAETDRILSFLGLLIKSAVNNERISVRVQEGVRIVSIKEGKIAYKGKTIKLTMYGYYYRKEVTENDNEVL